MFAGEAVVDSRHAKLLHETGEASYWSITVGDRTADTAVWGYPKPLRSVPPLGGHVAFYGEAVDAWFEEDDQVSRFPRDPYQRIDVRQGSQHVRVRVGDVVVAETTRPRMLFETGVPAQYYLPEADVHIDLLQPSSTTTECPYRGVASYRSLVGPSGQQLEDAAWTYAEPPTDGLPVAGHWGFMAKAIETEVDGELLPSDS